MKALKDALNETSLNESSARSLSSMTNEEIIEFFKLEFPTERKFQDPQHTTSNSISCKVGNEYIRYWYDEIIKMKKIVDWFENHNFKLK